MDGNAHVHRLHSLSSFTIFPKVVALDKEHEDRIELLVAIDDPDEVSRVSLGIDLSVPNREQNKATKIRQSVSFCSS